MRHVLGRVVCNRVVSKATGQDTLSKSKVISYKVLLLHMLVFDEIQEWFLAYMLFMRFHDLGAEEAQRLTVVERTLHL